MTPSPAAWILPGVETILAMAGCVGTILLIVAIVNASIASDRRRRIAEDAAKKTAEESARWIQFATAWGPDVATRLMRHEYWVGQTPEMLRASLGEPEDVDEHVVNMRMQHVYKYYHRGYGRYALRVTVEGGVVIGWDLV